MSATFRATGQALRESEEQYRTLFESIDEGLCIIEVIFDQQDKPVDYRFLEVNPAFERQTGLTGARGRTVREFVPKHEEHWFDIYGRISRTGEPARFEQRAAQLNRWYDVYAWRHGRPQDRQVAVLFNDVTARKNAEEALRRSEQELSDFFDNATMAMHWVGSDGIILRANQAELDMLGYGRDEYVGRHITEFHVDRPVIDDILTCLTRGEPVRERPARLRCRDGSIRDVLIDSSARFENGRFIHTRCFTRDVTERKRVDQDLGKLAAIVETSDDAIIGKDLNGVITSWNLGAERMFGYTAQEVIGRPVTILIPPDRIDEEPTILRRIREGLRIEHYETERRRKDGALIHISLGVSPILDGTGKIIGASKIARDITERKRAEARAQEDARTREALYVVSRTLAGELDMDRMVQAVTDTATEFSGAQFGAFFYNVKNAAGESYLLYALSGAPREAFEKFGMPRNTAVFEPTFSGREVVRLDDVTKDPRYGKNAPYYGMPKGHLPVRSYLAAPITSRTGEVFGALFFGHEQPGVFTERAEKLVTGIAAQAAVAMDNARLVAQLRESDRNKDDFLAMLSHELRNPLAPMRHCVTLLQQADEGEIRRHAGEILDRQVEHMTRLVEDLLDISRISRGDIDLRKNEVDLADVVRIAVETSRPLFEAAGHRLDVNLPRSPVNVVADRLRLAQVFSNLLNNAAKYTPAGGRIGLELSKANGTVAISVRDNGIGIAAGDMPRLFSMYTQLEGGRRRAPGGLGVGLALARQLVELHGGTIEARSEGAGHGSEFTVRIPLPAHRPGAVS
jgi:PAS domain S-box-containing protein